MHHGSCVMYRKCDIMYFYFMFLCAETEGEISALMPRVPRQDAKVSLQGFRYSSSCTEPSLAAVLATPFWSDPKYQSLRDRLRRAVPEVSLVPGGQFHTVNLRSMTVRRAEQVVEDSEPEACSSDMCLFARFLFKHPDVFLVFPFNVSRRMIIKCVLSCCCLQLQVLWQGKQDKQR